MARNSQPSVGLLRQALVIAERIQKLESELASILGQLPGAAASPRAASVVAAVGRKRKKSKISAEGRQRIAAAQRARWAKARKAKAA